MKDGGILAAVFILFHGNSATYRVGFTTTEGRKYNAHNLLLWDCVVELKKRNVKNFDLGGVEPNTAGGVTKFKQGMGARPFVTSGIYC